MVWFEVLQPEEVGEGHLGQYSLSTQISTGQEIGKYSIKITKNLLFRWVGKPTSNTIIMYARIFKTNPKCMIFYIMGYYYKIT